MKKMDSIKILLIIPAYNESEGILDVIQKVDSYRAKCDYYLDYIVINDGSTDNEEEILKKNDINHVELIQNLGIGGAVQTGYLYAFEKDYDIAIQYDGDGQHDIESLPNLIEPILKNEADFTVGSRFVRNSTSKFKSSSARQLGIKFLSSLIKFLSGVEIKDVTSGYRAGNKRVIKQFVDRYPSKYPEPESYMHLLAHKVRIKEVGVNMFERETGESSIKLISAINYMVTVSLSILFATIIGKRENKNAT
ncbi:glycosyltransferase family 2 protein [Enterococcus raffinosus]|uniref:glycosyltransferase family 2 protein n=1 Tax=Enterococcus raffinosus TaxID=71452 RepID=UPI003F5A053F